MKIRHAVITGLNKEVNMEKINWFQEITDRLRDYSEGDIWSDGNEILCKTESAAGHKTKTF